MTELFELPAALPRHPATYTDTLLPVLVDMLQGSANILDPFGGTGKIFAIEPFVHGANIEAVEIEPEWAAYHHKTTVGNALALPWPPLGRLIALASDSAQIVICEWTTKA